MTKVIFIVGDDLYILFIVYPVDRSIVSCYTQLVGRDDHNINKKKERLMMDDFQRSKRAIDSINSYTAVINKSYNDLMRETSGIRNGTRTFSSYEQESLLRITYDYTNLLEKVVGSMDSINISVRSSFSSVDYDYTALQNAIKYQDQRNVVDLRAKIARSLNNLIRYKRSAYVLSVRAEKYFDDYMSLITSF